MKGLLIKDIMLMKNQKKNWVIILLIFGAYSLLDMSGSMITFVAIMCIIFANSTISYDEFDNGYPFLFTMPFRRETYALEKYVLTVGMSWVAVVTMTVMLAIGSILGMNIDIADELLPNVCVAIFMSGVGAALVIPIQLKFGTEKGRLAMFSAFALVALAVMAVMTMIPGPDAPNAVAFLNALPTGFIIAFFALLTGIILVISYGFSVRIIKTKSF